MASQQTRQLARIAIGQAKLDFSGSALKEPYLRKITTARLKGLGLTLESPEFKEAYTLAMEALKKREEEKKKKDKKGFLRSLLPSPKMALL